MCVRMCVNAYNRARTRKRERERERGRISVLFGSKGQKLERRACRAQCAIWQLPRISTPLWPPLYLFPSSTLTHQRILHLPSTFFHPYSPSSLSVSFLPFPDVCKNDVEENRERQRGTRKADEWRHILLKTKRRGWKQVVRECTVLSSSSSFFFIRFYFLFFSPPFFFVSRRDRSTSVSFCSPPFFFIYLPFSPYNHPRTNEERTITFCFRLEDLLPPEPLDSSTVFCLHFNRPSATFHANILASSNNIVPPCFIPCSMLLASWIYPNTCNQLEYHR